MKTTTYTKEQVIDFINAQPDDRKIDFSESSTHPVYDKAECGCLLVHLVQHTYPEEANKYGVACEFAYADTYDGSCQIKTPRIEPSDMIDEGITTYGQLKQNLDQLFTE
jgi:hypothetical protein